MQQLRCVQKSYILKVVDDVLFCTAKYRLGFKLFSALCMLKYIAKFIGSLLISLLFKALEG